MYAPLSAEETKRRISLSKKDAHKGIDEARSVVADMLIRIAFTPDVCIEREPDLQMKTRKGKLLRYKTRHDTNKFLVECGAGAIRDIVQRDYEGDTILDNYLTCPPVARLVNVYGINLPTEAGYAFRIQQGTLDSCLFTKYKLDKAFRTDTHKCVDGTLYENKHTVQKQRDGTRKCSGDGTVTYQSLSYPLNWEDNEKTTVENHEFEDMEHRAMLADPRLHEVLIKHVCKMSG